MCKRTRPAAYGAASAQASTAERKHATNALTHAKVAIGDWKEKYDHDRPHSSLGCRTPACLRRDLCPLICSHAFGVVGPHCDLHAVAGAEFGHQGCYV